MTNIIEKRSIISHDKGQQVFFYFRTEISNLNDKIRRLEIAQANQRRQQAIAMAAMAAEKLNIQKLNGEFQSDSNLPNSANYGISPKSNNRQKLAIPVGKRLLLKVLFFGSWLEC